MESGEWSDTYLGWGGAGIWDKCNRWCRTWFQPILLSMNAADRRPTWRQAAPMWADQSVDHLEVAYRRPDCCACAGECDPAGGCPTRNAEADSFDHRPVGSEARVRWQASNKHIGFVFVRSAMSHRDGERERKTRAIERAQWDNVHCVCVQVSGWLLFVLL